MKAKKHIIIMLMAIFIGALEASAQSARRGTPQEPASMQVSTVRQYQAKKELKSSKNNNQVKSSHTPGRSNTHSKSKTYNRSDQNRQSVKNRSGQNHVKVSTTNSRNPRSTYKKPVPQNYGKTYNDPKHAERRLNQKSVYQNNTVYHQRNNALRSSKKQYYYPTKKVHVHVHPYTYHNHFRVAYYPSHREIVWTRKMYRDYVSYYPGYTWRYPIGYRINTISAFDARYNIGEVSRVYGRVYGAWFNRETDNLLLFFGGEFPHQQFTMIIPGKIARSYNWRPERYFLGQHIIATGLITSFEGKPELIVRDRHQMDIY